MTWILIMYKNLLKQKSEVSEETPATQLTRGIFEVLPHHVSTCSRKTSPLRSTVSTTR
jgi:hypothetical protein